MPAYKDEKQGTYYVSFYYTDYNAIKGCIGYGIKRVDDERYGEYAYGGVIYEVD